MTPASVMAYIAFDIESKVGGGRPFFELLDPQLRDPYWYRVMVMAYLEEFPDRPPIVMSGSFGRAFQRWLRASEFRRYVPRPLVIPDSLKPGRLARLRIDFRDKVFCFLDDSLYSGRTRDDVRRSIEEAGGLVWGAFVLYDGSTVPLTSVRSLYRYHG